jgi:hypothetical protein
MKSWYDLTNKEAKELERKFLSHEKAKEENLAMHMQIIIGIFLIVLCTSILTTLIIIDNIKWYIFIILLLSIFIGILLVILSTIEYHIKFNSWLEINHKIIKK